MAISKTEFVLRSKKLHGDKYDYSLIEYINTSTEVKIICKEHGIFTQKPSNHMRYGCRFCSNKANSIKYANKKRLTTKIFIERSKKLHGDKYDYSIVKYVDYETKIKIICKEHGIFTQTPHHHLAGINCPKCSFNRKLTTSSFIEKANLVHENRYDYSKTIYTHYNEKIEIICNTHGVFKQKPTTHLFGCGCQLCKESKGEIKIRSFLNKNNILFKPQFKFDDCKHIKKLSFDFYLPKFNTCIEFDGEQHFRIVEHWGGVIGFDKIKKRDKIKTEYCKNNNIRLLRIKYNENVSSILDDYLLK